MEGDSCFTSDGKNSDQSCTLFVRNLAFSTTSAELEECFSEIGPVKKCFVVQKKGSSNTCRGFGYVEFSSLEDAVKAKETIHQVSGRDAYISFANAKQKRTSRKKHLKRELSTSVDEKCTIACSNPAKLQDAVIRNLDGHVKHYEQRILDMSYLLIVFVSFKATVRALNKLRLLQKQGALSKELVFQLFTKLLKGARRRNRTDTDKSARLIVRNLSFQCSENDLQDLFGRYGEVAAVIPQKAGKPMGCGFVQFKSKSDAGAALEALNMHDFMGRPIAVDWSLPKDVFISSQRASDTSGGAPPSEESSMQEKRDRQSLSSESDSDDEDDLPDGRNNGRVEDEEMCYNEVSESESCMSGGEVDEECLEGISSQKHAKKRKLSKSKTDGQNIESDVHEGKTVFIRNLPYTFEKTELEDLCKETGKIEYVTICFNPMNDLPKGTAFVKFRTPEAARSFIEKSKTGEGIVFKERELKVDLAISHDEALRIENKKSEKTPKDNRNLYLVREGMIRAGTKAAIGTPEADLKKREELMAFKKRKLQNLNIFVSPTRLCVRNIPVDVGEKELQATFRKTVEDKSCRITECRIMRDLQRLDSSGIGKSKRFGFIQFSKHEHALLALHATNNNPDLFRGGHRLIVEFSLENRAALNKRQRTFDRNLAIRGVKPDSTNADSTKCIQNPKHSSVKDENMIKGMPSHVGPKLRHRDRGKQRQRKKPPVHRLTRSKKKDIEKQNVEVRNSQKITKSNMFKTSKAGNRHMSKKRNATTDNFDKLVNKYRNKLSMQSTKPKWFDD